MLVLSGLVMVLVVPLCTSAFSVNINQLGEDLEKRFKLGFLSKYFKFPVYVNPHPSCALEDEGCTLDTSCCGGLECKMAVDREGVKYTCQEKVEDPGQGTGTMTREEDEVDQEWQDLQESEDNNSLLGEIYRARLEELKNEEQKLVNDQYYMIKELQKPLSFDDMRELKQIKEVEDYKREDELRELRKWRDGKKAEEKQKKETENKLKDLAVERVAKVLKEEEHQKLEMFKEIQEQLKKKKSWF